jgi:hypothetical protein
MSKVTIAAHVLFAFSAVILGTCAIFKHPKLNHRIAGKCYLAAIGLVGLTGLAIYKGGAWNLTHYMAFLNIALILTGHFYYFLYKKDLHNHGRLMTWSVFALYLEVLAEVYFRML